MQVQGSAWRGRVLVPVNSRHALAITIEIHSRNVHDSEGCTGCLERLRFPLGQVTVRDGQIDVAQMREPG
jgi:hypothetical protein